MNRDHLLLGSGENRLIHSFIRSWKPNLIVDVHTYPPSREYLEQRNYVMHQDVLVDCPTNLGVRRRLEVDKLEGLIKAIQSNLSPLKYICDRYVLVNPEGKTRHSTSDIVDARNFLSLRYDILTILVEGREPLPEEDQKTQIERTVLAEYHTLLSIIKWAVNNAPLFTNDSNLPPYSTGDRIAIRYKYDKPEKIYKMNLENKLTKKIEEVAFPSYQDSSKATRTVRMPYAYAIPSDKSRVINLLHRHGFKSQHGTESELFLIQKYFILASKYQEFRVKDKPRPPTGVRLISTEEEDNLSEYEIFLTSQEGGYSLPLFLEPQSEYGLPRYERLNLAVNPGDTYAIVRVIKKKETTKDIQDKETTKDIQDKETTKDINPAESVNKSLSPIRR